MSAAEKLRSLAAGADRLLEQDLSPHQNRIVQNYRRHTLLEALNMWEQIFVPEMTVDHPVHRINRTHQTMVLDGRDAVAGYYASKAADGGNINVVDTECLSVADWGIATEMTMSKYAPAQMAIAKGLEVDDPNATYRISSRIAMVWHFNEFAQLLGEHLYEDGASVGLEKVSGDEVITQDDVQRILVPMLNPMPPSSLRSA